VHDFISTAPACILVRVQHAALVNEFIRLLGVADRERELERAVPSLFRVMQEAVALQKQNRPELINTFIIVLQDILVVYTCHASFPEILH
jgi:hypothetical protein